MYQINIEFEHNGFIYGQLDMDDCFPLYPGSALTAGIGYELIYTLSIKISGVSSFDKTPDTALAIKMNRYIARIAEGVLC